MSFIQFAPWMICLSINEAGKILPGDNNKLQNLFDLPKDWRAGIHVIELFRMADEAK
jgi:hypothetical protein